MKKLIAVLAVLMVLGTSSVFALAIGAQGGYTVGGSGNGALTFKLDDVPCVFAVDACFGNYTSIGVTADWWIANPSISGPWGWYFGPGVAGAFSFANNWTRVDIAPRVVIGTNVFLLDNFLELYLQAAWQPTFHIWLSGGGEGAAKFDFLYIPINFGFRFWF